jgi:nucleoside-diphosphate-sugar epimerase
MRVLITGAAGFIGQLVAKKLLDDGNNVHSLILTDIIEPPIPSNARSPGQAKAIKADLCTQSSTVVTKDIEAVYVFHGIMSSGAEADFDLGMKANFDATRALLEAIRKTCPGVRVIYASSQAVYNNSVTLPVTEAQMPTPETSYGAEKMMCEYLITEYTRRGFIDGISCRFPTVTVRPGKPTAAASSFISGMIREPMNGIKCSIPLEDKQWRHWLCSPRILVQNLVHAATKLDLNRLAKFDRCLNFPGSGGGVITLANDSRKDTTDVSPTQDMKVKVTLLGLIGSSCSATYMNSRCRTYHSRNYPCMSFLSSFPRICVSTIALLGTPNPSSHTVHHPSAKTPLAWKLSCR